MEFFDCHSEINNMIAVNSCSIYIPHFLFVSKVNSGLVNKLSSGIPLPSLLDCSWSTLEAMYCTYNSQGYTKENRFLELFHLLEIRIGPCMDNTVARN